MIPEDLAFKFSPLTLFWMKYLETINFLIPYVSIIPFAF